MSEEIRQYGAIKLLNIESSEPYVWEEGNATHIRVSLPPIFENTVRMGDRGFFLADRTLDVSINLTRVNIDFEKLIRIRPSIVSGHKDELLSIARQCFTTDRRFHIAPQPDPAIAETVLAGWIEELDQVYLAKIHGKAVGFLALTEDDEGRFVHLAAVLERYRVTGAGLSLYASAALDCLNSGVRFLHGRISSANTAVMNLYTLLGATFSNPLDVYLKRAAIGA